MKRTGHADLPLHSGTVPKWLADRMMTLGTQISESLIMNFGRDEFILRLSDPLWFQSFGAVLGMDWHSSGITTSVMYALKRGLNPRAHELGIVICGGRGKYSRKTPDELLYLSDATGLDGNELVRSSRLCAKVDNTALQDGFQLYQHNFILSIDGSWSVVQQGMNVREKSARRYHWCSLNLDKNEKDSYVNSPHSAIVGENQGRILNLTDKAAENTRSKILDISRENPDRMISEFQKLLLGNEKDGLNATYRNLTMPSHEEVRAEDVNLKRLGAVLALSYENQNDNFEDLLLTPQLGPRTLQSLSLVSEVIYGTPSRFTDPARFSFAHGGKDGHPFPVPLKVYDKTIEVMGECIERAKLGYNDKSDCLRRLHSAAIQIEKNCQPMADFDAVIEHEKDHSKDWGGRTVMD
ncbi:MAG: DUF763 domain-containing protein [Treponemataceae bacterium]|nr:DUF763 domain-containing protein [Treponemataceae bacterium]